MPCKKCKTLDRKKLPILYTLWETSAQTIPGSADGAGASGSGDIRAGQLAGSCKQRAETISGEFNSQDVANTLWAFATMGRKPGEWMMGQLERRAEAISGEFNSQDVANTRGKCAFSHAPFGCSQQFCLLFGLGMRNSFFVMRHRGEPGPAASRQHLCSQGRSWVVV